MLYLIWERIGSKIREWYEEKILQLYIHTVYVSVEFWELSNKDIQLYTTASQ